MGKNNDLSGTQINEWTVLKYIGNNYYTCKCSCGVIKNIRSDALKDGRSKSCGHLKIDNIKGQKFNEWTALEYVGNGYWKCQCSCGKIKDVLVQHLKNGSSRSCGHTRISNQPIDIKNKKFNELEALEYAGNQRWICRCSCGKIVKVGSYALTHGLTKSCGHFNITKNLEDLSLQTFGEWTVLEYVGHKKWRCQCSCGTIKDIYASHLKSGRSKSCGCKIASNYRDTMLKRYGDISSSRINYNRSAKQIELASDKDKLKEYLIEYEKAHNKKIDTFELSDVLGIQHNTVIWMINKYDLSDNIRYLSGESISEIDIYNYIKSIYKGTIIRKDRSVLDNCELDIYIPDKKLAIEFNGSYWYSEIYKDKNYHKNKSLKCIASGIRLIHIFEYEWNNPNTRKKIERLIYSTLNTLDKIYARNCEVKRVDRDTYKGFIEEYHLQNYCNAYEVYGLYSNNELVQLMSVGKPRFNNKYQYEILRICTKNNIIVVGGIEKIWKSFLNDKKPKSVVSYCDISKFSGNVYKKLGFTLLRYSNPNYVWINKNNKVLSRYQTQKKELIKNNLGSIEQTEDDIMHSLGYFKVYNSGNAVYINNIKEN